MSKKLGSSPVSLTVDRDESERRKADLESYLAENVWNSRPGIHLSVGEGVPTVSASPARCGLLRSARTHGRSLL